MLFYYLASIFKKENKTRSSISNGIRTVQQGRSLVLSTFLICVIGGDVLQIEGGNTYTSIHISSLRAVSPVAVTNMTLTLLIAAFNFPN